MRSLLALIVALAGAAGAAAQPVPPEAPEIFTDRIEVRVVNVEVYVADRQGRPISGLGRNDFELFVDGKKVEITHFEAVAETSPVRQPGTLPPLQDGPRVEVTAKKKPLHIVLFVDNFNLRPQTRNRVLRQLESFLQEALEPEDRVMIVTHDLGLQVRRPFTERARPLEKDLESVARLATRGPLTDNLTRQTLERIQSSGCTSEANAEARSYMQQVRSETVGTLSTLRRLVESLSGLEGRKAFVYVSDGLPLRPGEEVLAYLAKICGDSGSPFDVEDVVNELRKVTTAANASQVTFYSLEAAGLRGFTSVSVESMSSFQTPAMDFVQNANVQDTLFNLASETGGQAVLNTNDLRPQLASIAGDLRAYYSLGFSAEHRSDGRIHDLRVVVNRPGLRVRSRSSYRDSTWDERFLARLDAALWHGAVDDDLGLVVEVDEPKKEGKDQFLVPVKVLIPLAKVTLLPRGTTFSGRLSIVVSSHDKEGRYAPPRRIEVPIEVTASQMEQAARQTLSHELSLVLRKGEFVLALGVWDAMGGGTGFVRKKLMLDKAGKLSLGN